MLSGRTLGGMRKRVALAATLAYDPHLLLMDEPFGALDAQTRVVLQDELLRIWNAHQRTVLFVTHDIGEASPSPTDHRDDGPPAQIKAEYEVGLARPRQAATRATIRVSTYCTSRFPPTSSRRSRAKC